MFSLFATGGLRLLGSRARPDHRDTANCKNDRYNKDLVALESGQTGTPTHVHHRSVEKEVYAGNQAEQDEESSANHHLQASKPIAEAIPALQCTACPR